MKAIIGMVTLILILLGMLFIYAKVEFEWLTWANKHCVIIGKEYGGTSVGVGFGGESTMIMPIVHPDRTTYKCDDGIVYTK